MGICDAPSAVGMAKLEKLKANKRKLSKEQSKISDSGDKDDDMDTEKGRGSPSSPSSPGKVQRGNVPLLYESRLSYFWPSELDKFANANLDFGKLKSNPIFETVVSLVFF